VVGTFGPGLRVARFLATTPPTLAPHQSSWSTEAREVTDLDRLAFTCLWARGG
jgi:hypothetical protein